MLSGEVTRVTNQGCSGVDERLTKRRDSAAVHDAGARFGGLPIGRMISLATLLDFPYC